MLNPSEQLIEEVTKEVHDADCNCPDIGHRPAYEMSARGALSSTSIQALVEALRRAEWGSSVTIGGHPFPVCPVCGSSREGGHLEDCTLAKALEPFEAVPEEAR